MKNLLMKCVVILAIAMSPMSQAGGSSQNEVRKSDQITAYIEVFNDMAEEFALSKVQKNEMLMVFYKYGPKLLIGIGDMLNNRSDMLLAYDEQADVSMTMIDVHAANQSALFRQLIVDKDLLKQDILAILNPQQKDMFNDLVERLIAARLARI